MASFARHLDANRPVVRRLVRLAAIPASELIAVRALRTSDPRLAVTRDGS